MEAFRTRTFSREHSRDHVKLDQAFRQMVRCDHAPVLRRHLRRASPHGGRQRAIGPQGDSVCSPPSWLPKCYCSTFFASISLSSFFWRFRTPIQVCVLCRTGLSTSCTPFDVSMIDSEHVLYSLGEARILPRFYGRKELGNGRIRQLSVVQHPLSCLSETDESPSPNLRTPPFQACLLGFEGLMWNLRTEDHGPGLRTYCTK